MCDFTNPAFTDEDKAREFLEASRWPAGPVCPFCGQLDTNHEPHVAACGDCGNQTHAMAGAGRWDDGRVAFRPPSAPRVMVGADVSRVAEIDVSPCFLAIALIFGDSFSSLSRTADSAS